MAASSVWPTEVRLNPGRDILNIAFDNGDVFQLRAEYLRVESPSAEVRGHGPGQETLQTGKRKVDILSVDPVGSYAIQPRFSDGHATGIYAWDYLHGLGRDHDKLWAEYLEKLVDAGASRDE